MLSNTSRLKVTHKPPMPPFGGEVFCYKKKTKKPIFFFGATKVPLLVKV